VGGVARNLSQGTFLRPKGPKFEAEGQKKRKAFFVRGQRAISPPDNGFGGSAVSSPVGFGAQPNRKCILHALGVQKTHLVAANVV